MQGQYTAVVYGLIRQQRYQEAVAILSAEQQKHPASRAALSLLGYCYFHMQDFPAAAATYEALLGVCPDVEEYRVYLAQALYKAGCYQEATRAAARVQSPRYARRMLLLRVGRVGWVGLVAVRRRTQQMVHYVDSYAMELI